MIKRIKNGLLLGHLLLLAACGASNPPDLSQGHLGSDAEAADTIPAPVIEVPILPEPEQRPGLETYTVVVNQVPVRDDVVYHSIIGTRKDDNIPYRAMGPVTVEEYESRQERYDTQLGKELKIDLAGKSSQEKLQILRNHRIAKYEQLKDAVYQRRGWNKNGVPTLAKVKALGLDSPEILELIREFQ